MLTFFTIFLIKNALRIPQSVFYFYDIATQRLTFTKQYQNHLFTIFRYLYLYEIQANILFTEMINRVYLVAAYYSTD
ncbi:hypothetical protein DEU42_11324 [Flavobacterium sp. AG291]|nr:hypothetical protein DEU42_11324 [Flavobacterium sp. AG291]